MQRYSDRPFPAYRHLPGSTPHPTRHPDGHSYAAPAWTGCFEPERADDCDEFRYGIDLHNHGYYWECHECLEGIWRSFERGSTTALFLQGLILLSVAHSHAHCRGRPDLGVKLAGWALERWIGVAPTLYAGLDLALLRRLTEQWRVEPTAGVVLWRLAPALSVLQAGGPGDARAGD